jgi:protein-disulfide isomerase
MKKTLWVAFCLALAVFSLGDIAAAASNDETASLKNEIEALKRGQVEMQRELQEIKNVLRSLAPSAPPAFEGVVLNVKGDPFKGKLDAKVTVIEFSDYQCPFCGRHARDTLPQIEREYVASGKIRYVFRNFPIESIHPQAFKAHEAANCAGDQGKYWEMHDRLFAFQQALGASELPTHADALGLNREVFEECLASGRHAEKIRSDLKDGMKLGIRGTPTFLVGAADSDPDTVKLVNALRGSQPYAAFKQLLDSVLAGEK